MLTDDFKNMIDQYFDGELTQNQESFLFSELSKENVCREYFKQANKLKVTIQQTTDEFPSALERKILISVRNTRKYPILFWKTKLLPLAGYSFAVILLLFSLFMFLEIREYRRELQTSVQQISDKQETINLLINSLPGVEVESELKNAVIIQANL